MKIHGRRLPLLWIVLFLSSIVISLVLYFIFPKPLEKRILLFPERKGLHASRENRFLPAGNDVNAALHYIVESLIQGPSDVTLLRVLPRQTKLKSAWVYKTTAVIDFDAAVQGHDVQVPLGPRERIKWLYRIVAQNFPYIERIIILINGTEAVID